MNIIMIQRLKKLSGLKGKKRYIVFGLLAVELMSLPAAAQIVKSVSLQNSPSPIVMAVEIPNNQPGLSRYLVTSNTGFIVKANNLNGDVNVDLHKSGALGGNVRFGDAAQLPGPKVICSKANGPSSKIYEANRKTEAQDGTAPDRAVVFEFQYATEHLPEFVFVAEDDTDSTLIACKAAAA